LISSSIKAGEEEEGDQVVWVLQHARKRKKWKNTKNREKNENWNQEQNKGPSNLCACWCKVQASKSYFSGENPPRETE